MLTTKRYIHSNFKLYTLVIKENVVI